MIFGRMGNAGKEFILVGLSDENIREMKAGKPLSIGPVPGDPTLAAVQIILICGETEKEMVETLKKLELVSPETSMNDML